MGSKVETKTLFGLTLSTASESSDFNWLMVEADGSSKLSMSPDVSVDDDFVRISLFKIDSTVFLQAL